jgi:peptidoglycan/LPS O-acetylase OafA/YrhL
MPESTKPGLDASQARGVSSRSAALDGIRGLAILAVLGFHFAFEFAPGGAFGVDVFFVLSAFLITSMLAREQQRTGFIDFTSFYVRRGARLVPALLVFLVFVALPVSAVIGTLNDAPLSSVVVLFYLSDFARAMGVLPEPWGHTWSLAVEEQFYLVWPALLLLLLVRRRSRLAMIGVVIFLFAAVITTVTYVWLGDGTNYFLPTGHLPALATGCLAAFLFHRHERFPRWMSSTPVAVAAVCGVIGMSVLHRQGWPTALGVVVTLPVLLLLGGLVLHAAGGRPTFVNRLLSMAWLTWLGTRSYGLYLYHVPLYLLFSSAYVPLSRTANAVLAFAVSVILTELSFRLIERPLTRRGHVWSRNHKARVQARRA